MLKTKATTKANFTDQQFKDYEKAGGQFCPFCGTYGCVESYRMDALEQGLYSVLEVSCKNCHSHWFEKHTLTSIFKIT